MIWLFTWIVMATFFWPNELVEFKQVEYELNKTYWDVYTKCDSQLSSIAYAFAMRETGNWKWLKQNNKNNLFWLRHWRSTTSVRPKFSSYGTKRYTPSWYNVYVSRTDSIYDFMNQFYLGWCKLTKWYVKWHKNWKNWWNEWVDSYYKFIKSQQTKYNNKVKERLIIRWRHTLDWLWLKDTTTYTWDKFNLTVVDTRTMTYSILWI